MWNNYCLKAKGNGFDQEYVPSFYELKGDPYGAENQEIPENIFEDILELNHTDEKTLYKISAEKDPIIKTLLREDANFIKY